MPPRHTKEASCPQSSAGRRDREKAPPSSAAWIRARAASMSPSPTKYGSALGHGEKTRLLPLSIPFFQLLKSLNHKSTHGVTPRPNFVINLNGHWNCISDA